MRKIFTILMLLLFLTPSQAVLNESDLVKTLEVLRDELEQLQKQQQINIAKYKQFDEIQHEKLLQLMQKSNQTALILYSQKQDYIFNLTYACNEATNQYQDFIKQQQPYFKILEKIDSEIDRYNKLIDALLSLPPRIDGNIMNDSIVKQWIANEGHIVNSDSTALVDVRDSISSAVVDSLMTQVTSGRGRKSYMLTPAQREERDECVRIAMSIRDALVEIHDSVKEDYDHYVAISEKFKKLNDYAEEKFADIQQNIFKNGDTSFIKILLGFPIYLHQAYRDIMDKYVLTGEERVKSDWKGPVVIMFTFFALFYLIIVIIICNVVIRYIVPSRVKGENFELRKNYYITACSMVLFSIVMFFMSMIVEDNFFKMASELLVEFTILMSAIVASLLFRIEAKKLKYGYRLYIPMMVMGFCVILFRIIFVPNSVVSLLMPPILLIATLIQFDGVRKYSRKVESSDRMYAWISFITIAVSCVASWCGFTLLAVQIFMWWMMQLTCIHGITCCVDAMKIYEDKILKTSLRIETEKSEEEIGKIMVAYKNHTGEYLKYTWIGDLINMTVVPVMGVLSLPLCIYWASDIFDMAETCWDLFVTDFIEVPDVFELSLFKMVAVSSSYFIFKFVNYALRAAYASHIESRKEKSNKQANITLANNVISIAVWGIFFIFSLVLMNVPSSGISIVTAGLATGIGFALKDVLNNFFYGISLMAGRVRVGEVIECDGIRGTVHSITYQSTQIQTLDGSIMAFLNSNLFAKSFKNLTRNHDFELVKLPIGVSYGTNVVEVREMLLKKIKEYIDNQNKKMPNINPNSGVSVVFSGFGESSVDLYVVLWVRVLTKLVTCSEINEIIYNTLNENNVEIPFPQRDIHVKDMVK